MGAAVSGRPFKLNFSSGVNYVTLVNKKKAQKKLEKKKYCKFCDKHTLHKECK